MDQLLVQIFQLQCDIAIAQIQCSEWKGPERFDAGTIVNGKNVGGKWKPSDKNGAKKGDSSFADVQQKMAETWKQSPEISKAILAAPPFPTSTEELEQSVESYKKKKRGSLLSMIKAASGTALVLTATLGAEVAIGLLLETASTLNVMVCGNARHFSA